MAALNHAGHLPEGVHDLSLDEIESQFGRFGSNGTRHRLVQKLREYVRELSGVEGFDSLIVDGSFVTAKDEPSDIDLIAVFTPERIMAGNWLPYEQQLLDRGRAIRRFGFDVAVARVSGPEYTKWVEYFEQVKGNPGLRKGMVRVRP